jgi:hypothetical protein
MTTNEILILNKSSIFLRESLHKYFGTEIFITHLKRFGTLRIVACRPVAK